MSLFKKIHTFEKRLEESTKIVAKYPNRIPIIVEKSTNSTNIPNIDKKKFLVPNDLTIGQFMYVIRKRIHLNQEQAIYLFIDNTLPTISSIMSQIYNEHKDKDGFLYFNYSGENTFG